MTTLTTMLELIYVYFGIESTIIDGMGYTHFGV